MGAELYNGLQRLAYTAALLVAALAVLTGVRHGETLGSPVAIMVENKDFKNWLEVILNYGLRFAWGKSNCYL